MPNRSINNAWKLTRYIEEELATKGTITLKACHLASINTIVNIIREYQLRYDNKFLDNAFDRACSIKRELKDKRTIILGACAELNTIINAVDRYHYYSSD